MSEQSENTQTKFQLGQEFAKKMDEEDPLRKFRDKFYIPKTKSGKDVIYFVGNSLGLQPKKAAVFVDEELAAWRDLAIDGHLSGKHPWYPYHEFLTESTARLVGAKPVEVVVMNTLTVNLHLMLTSFYRPTKIKNKILVEGGAFPQISMRLRLMPNYTVLGLRTSLSSGCRGRVRAAFAWKTCES